MEFKIYFYVASGTLAAAISFKNVGNRINYKNKTFVEIEGEKKP